MSKEIDLDQLVIHESIVPANIDTRERLQALRDDPNAGFLPFTHAEKSQAIDILDYLDNKSQFPAGLGNRLQEIFLRQKALQGIDGAKRAMFSLAYEYGDYALNALSQASALEDLKAQIDENHLNPRPTLAEEFPEGHVAIPALVRFIDVLAIREENQLPSSFDPLHTTQDRELVEAEKVELDKVKNKSKHDVYTAPETPGLVQQRIEDFSKTTTIKDVRHPLTEAIDNEHARLRFWTDRVRDTRKHGAAWIIGKQLLEQIEAPQV